MRVPLFSLIDKPNNLYSEHLEESSCRDIITDWERMTKEHPRFGDHRYAGGSKIRERFMAWNFSALRWHPWFPQRWFEFGTVAFERKTLQCKRTAERTAYSCQQNERLNADCNVNPWWIQRCFACISSYIEEVSGNFEAPRLSKPSPIEAVFVLAHRL
jgi:hypothetical protein